MNTCTSSERLQEEIKKFKVDFIEQLSNFFSMQPKANLPKGLHTLNSKRQIWCTEQESSGSKMSSKVEKDFILRYDAFYTCFAVGGDWDRFCKLLSP